MSDQWLSALNVWLQWLAVAGTALGLLSGIGLIFTRKTLSDRQATRLLEARQDAAGAKRDAESARQLSEQQAAQLANARAEAAAAQTVARQLTDEVEAIRRYSYVATLTFNGNLNTKGDVIARSEISPLVEGTWLEVARV
jgi:hypothetical protein